METSSFICGVNDIRQEHWRKLIDKKKPEQNPFRSFPPEVFLGKGVLKICRKFIGEHPLPKCDFNKVAKQLY